MDILSYAATLRNANVSNVYTQSIVTPRVAIPTLTNLSASGCCNSGPNIVPGAYSEDVLTSVLCAMECLDSISMKRRNVPNVCGFKVWDTVYSRCGCCCAWTVPAGATCVQFQIWGSGAGTSGVCCCGGSPFGPSGAYATVTIPAVPGCVYTLCAGCAYCCVASQTTPGTGATSYVTGYGLSNFCAMPGTNSQQQPGVQCSVCWYTNWPAPGGAGASTCNGWNFCWDGSNDEVSREYEYNCCAMFYGTTTVGSTVYGIRGMIPRFCVTNSSLFTSSTESAPIVGYLNISRFKSNFSCLTTYGYCGGCYASVSAGASGGFMQIPGQGGWNTMSCGGISALTTLGDSGRGGMVCVSWC